MKRAARLLVSILLGLVISVRFAGSSPQEDIVKKQSQLEKLRKEIEKFEDRLKEKGKKETATLELLDTYDRQAVLLRRLIAKIRDQAASLQRGIDQTKQSIGDLTNQISLLKRHYANYVSAVYKFGRTYDIELLLSSRSLNQSLIRSEYLKRFSDQRKKDLSKIGTKRDDLEQQSFLLEKQLLEERHLMDEKRKEEKNLATKMKKRKTLLAEIRRDKKNYQLELDRKKQAVKDLAQLISKLIEEERAKREREKAMAGKGKETRPETERGAGFETRRGRLRWPVTQGHLASRFGNQEHPTLHTVTQNTGIDIAVPAGTNVEAVADGEVSKIYWLPSFGNLVILDHKNGFRTVYAHLSDISVNEGDNVKEGESIGKTGESISGPLLHFEIYKEREKQDPEQWLRPRGVSQK